MQPSDYLASMLERVNQERATKNLPPLRMHSMLQAAAQRQADDMAANNFISHQGSDGSKMAQRTVEAGFTGGAVAENVAAGQKTVSAVVIDELMPRTTLGSQYFTKALQESNLPAERFVSVVAPSTASSSWVRKLALTQTCTLQRLDLSRARVPMSVLLQELTTLPRLTHLRLPRQILRDENLEHLVAALAYADLLPRLRCLDENVRQAMDRMEKSYLMQLDMVTFLLQKPGASNQARAGD
ncbi:hypothetical protein ON010_g1710 [Phytophthora cinnamomi]|nr:hypothetical protein ON010_g1710 [Phytophthora cinnamomi]